MATILCNQNHTLTLETWNHNHNRRHPHPSHSHNHTHTARTSRTVTHTQQGHSSYHPQVERTPHPQHTVSHMVTRTQPDLHPGDRWPQPHTRSPTPGHAATKTHSQSGILSPLPPALTDRRLWTRPVPAPDSRPLTFCLPLVASGSPWS